MLAAVAFFASLVSSQCVTNACQAALLKRQFSEKSLPTCAAIRSTTVFMRKRGTVESCGSEESGDKRRNHLYDLVAATGAASCSVTAGGDGSFPNAELGLQHCQS